MGPCQWQPGREMRCYLCWSCNGFAMESHTFRRRKHVGMCTLIYSWQCSFVCVCVCVWFKKYSNHLCVRKSSQNLNAFSLFVLCLFVIVFCCVVYLPSERYLLFRVNASEAWSFLQYTEDKKNWKGKISIFVLFSVINLCSYELKICHRHVLCLLFW